MNQVNVVPVSGGKDSAACLLLAMERKAPNIMGVFADTGHEHQDTYDYVRYLEGATGVRIQWVRAEFSRQIAGKRDYIRDKWPTKLLAIMSAGEARQTVERALSVLTPTGNPFLDLCMWKGRFPSTKTRFCSEELKRNPMIEQVQLPLMEAGNQVIVWQGMRADESPARAALPELEHAGTDPTSGGELWNYRPILKWTAQDTFEMQARYGIKPNPLYQQGMGRVGCMPCIHSRKDELLEIGRRFPKEIERVHGWEQLVRLVSKRGDSSFFPQADGRGNDIYEAVEWSKTYRGGTVIDPSRAANDDLPDCSSIYGLCG